MAQDPPERTVAILMDFENTRDANLQKLLSHGASFGQVIIRRAYADWTRYSDAANQLREAGFEAVHQFTTGHGSKNATDINLTVDAMDILWSRPVDVFLLVTADSDFAKLAMRIREGGKKVIGAGAKGRVGRALVQACDQYLYYDQAKPKRTRTRAAAEGRPSGKTPAPRLELTPHHHIVLTSMESAANSAGDVYGSPLHRSIRRLYPDFSYREEGHNSFRSFVESLAPVIETKTAKERSDFVVEVADAYEDQVEAALEALDAQQQSASEGPGGRGGDVGTDGILLDKSVQDRIHQEWSQLAGKNGRLAGSKAGSVVAAEYGVDRLTDTPLQSLDGILDAAPELAKKWRRDRSTMVKRKG